MDLVYLRRLVQKNQPARFPLLDNLLEVILVLFVLLVDVSL
jgi:hypothetical protein